MFCWSIACIAYRIDLPSMFVPGWILGWYRGEGRIPNVRSRKYREGLVDDRAVQTVDVVSLTILLAEQSCFEQMTEDFSGQELVLERDIKTFDVHLSPRSLIPVSTRALRSTMSWSVI